jgi:hypothetical protein
MSTCNSGSGDCQRTSHHCTCRLPVVDLPSQGIALWSDSPVVGAKLASNLPMQVSTPGVFRIDGTDWPERLESVLDNLSPIERTSIRGAHLDGSGNCDPWKAVNADSLLIQARSAWLPGVLNDRRLVSHLQPIVRSADRSTFGYEALARAEVDGQLKNGGDLVDAARAHNAAFDLVTTPTTTNSGADTTNATSPKPTTINGNSPAIESLAAEIETTVVQ